MANSLAIPESAVRGDWLRDQTSNPSGPGNVCLDVFDKLSRGDSVWLDNPSSGDGVSPCSSTFPYLFVRTGGTAGIPRFARHTWATMAAAVQGLQEILGKEPISSWCCLPVWHVGGWMQVVRAVETGGNVLFGHYLDLTKEDFEFDLTRRVVSLVPTQLHRLLVSSQAVQRLRESRLVLVGGGPMSQELAQKARIEKLPLSPTYGLTETAGTVTFLPPERFLAGEIGVGSVLPHLEVKLRPETKTLAIRGKSLCLGYHDTDFSPSAWFETADLVERATDGAWRILGRTDRVVNTGGEKVNPTEVEAIIHQSRLADDCLALGLPDPEWGERLVAFCVPKKMNIDLVQKVIHAELSGAKVPKDIIPVEVLPLNEMGKPDYELARRMLRP